MVTGVISTENTSLIYKNWEAIRKLYAIQSLYSHPVMHKIRVRIPRKEEAPPSRMVNLRNL